MPIEKIEYLVHRYFSDACTLEEKDELARWIQQSGDNDALRNVLQQAWEKYEPVALMPDEVSGRILSSLFGPQQETHTAPVVPLQAGRPRRNTWWAAAAIILVVLAGAYFWRTSVKPSAIATAPLKSAAEATSYIRNITLPDGSTVVLQAGSTLDYPSNFGKGARTLSLQGEAYFDVAQDATRPFSIHTGRVKTTVLGTAFNIKAWPGQAAVSVSVTKGTVKVEADSTLLAVLLPDQQINYNLSSPEKAQQQKVDAKTLVTDWTKQDMVFEETRFDSIAAMLMKRYDVTIRFTNAAMQKCPVHAYFNGTEKLEKVLSVLCKVRGAAYTMPDENTVVIDGEGCTP